MSNPCEVCGNGDTMVVLPLVSAPLEDQFLRTISHQEVYPVDLTVCKACGFTYLGYKVSPELSYSEYLYESKVTNGLRAHYENYAREIFKACSLSNSSLVVDLGSNDGSMLGSFARLGARVIGVEPSPRVAKIANELGLETICNFFTDNVLDEIVQKHGLADVVTANYMYANVNDVVLFTRRVAKLLAPNGFFIVQTGYHPDQFKIGMFDYIYHEHFSYFSVEVIERIFALAGLTLLHVERTEPKGGSIMAVGGFSSDLSKVNGSVASLISAEKDLGLKEIDYYREFWNRVEVQKQRLLAEVRSIRSKGFKIAGFGASHSTTTLIYNFGLADFLDFIVDDNPTKQGTFSPGKHIPVYDVNAIAAHNIRFVIILAWQHCETIIARHLTLIEKGVVFLRPLPEFKFISHEHWLVGTQTDTEVD